jgi:hypothetical protein
MPVSRLVVKENNFLQKLSKSKSQKNFQRLILNASSQQLLSFVEVALNILKARIYLNSIQKSRLKKHAPILREISQVRNEKKARRLLLQKGGSLPLIAILTPVLIEIAKSLIEK